MRRPFTQALALTLAAATLSWAQAQPSQRVHTWNKLRYRGGTVEAKVNPYDWNTTLGVSTDSITFVFGTTTFRLKPSQVVSLSHGVEARNKVSMVVDAVAATAMFNPIALFGILRARQDHLIGIVYLTEDGKRGAVLVETDSFKAVLPVLETVTGKRAQPPP